MSSHLETPFELVTRDEDSFDFQPRPQSQRPRYNNQQEYRPRYEKNYNNQNKLFLLIKK